MTRKMLIVGAGIAGLSAGCYGRMNGYDTLILESHNKPGGLCTAWKRKDYIIDGCIHWMVGVKPGSSFYRTFEELGALQGRQMVRHEEFMRIVGSGGKMLTVYTNVDRLARELLDLAPADAKLIAEFADAVHKLTRMQAPPDPSLGGRSALGGGRLLDDLYCAGRPLCRRAPPRHLCA
jgi:phytoene dehydrogenase-like protein